MTIRPIDPTDPDFRQDPAFVEAVTRLSSGEPVAVPTETVYGLAADATSSEATARIYAAKDRPRFNPLISHVADLETARAYGEFDQTALRLAEAFWPGPLTLVVPKSGTRAVCDLVTAGLETLALRVPDAPVMQALCAACGFPLAAPSANRSGRISPTSAQAVAEDMQDRLALILDTGPTRIGVESTIVSLADGTARLLRPGGIPREAIEAVLEHPLEAPASSDEDRPSAPGMLSSHYAPRARVRLNAASVAEGETLLAFGPHLPEGWRNAVAVENLSPSGDLMEAAAGLFAAMRCLDSAGAAVMAVMPIPEHGLGEAINDRLSRAAAPR